MKKFFCAILPIALIIASILFTLILYVQALSSNDFTSLYFFAMVVLPYILVVCFFWFALFGSVYVTKNTKDLQKNIPDKNLKDKT